MPGRARGQPPPPRSARRLSGLAGDRVVDPDARPDGGESLRDLYWRVAGFADELAGWCRAMDGRTGQGDRRRRPRRHAPGADRLPARHPGRADEVGAAQQRMHHAVAARLAGPRRLSRQPARREGVTMNPTALQLPVAGRQAAPDRPDDGDRRRHPARPVHRPRLVGRRVHRLRQVRLGHRGGHQRPATRRSTCWPAHEHRVLLRRDAVREVRAAGPVRRFPEVLRRARSCQHVEVSNGTIALSNTEKASYIRKLADDFTVISEVGLQGPEPLRAAAAERVDRLHRRGPRRRRLAGHPGGQGERPVRHLPAGRRAQVRADRGRARGRHRPGQPALRGADHRAAGALHHPDRAGREPRQHPRVRASSGWRRSASGCAPTR